MGTPVDDDVDKLISSLSEKDELPPPPPEAEDDDDAPPPPPDTARDDDEVPGQANQEQGQQAPEARKASMVGSLSFKPADETPKKNINLFSRTASNHWKSIRASVVKNPNKPVGVGMPSGGLGAEPDEYSNLHKKAQGAFKVLLSSYTTAQQKATEKKDIMKGGLEVNDMAQKRTTLKSLKKVVDFKISQGENYRQLLLFGCLIFAYCFMITQLRNIESSFAVETSLQDLLHAPLLESGTDHLKPNDIYDFVRQITTTVFQDPVCGDGVCDYPSEYAGFGPFGCERDCGENNNVTGMFFIPSDPLVPSGQKAETQPVYIVAAAEKSLPDFRLNVYLPRVRSFYYEEDLPLEHEKFIEFMVPDDNVTVCMFQHNKLYEDEVSKSSAGIFLNIDPASLPDGPDSLNYNYGNFGEALAWNAGVKNLLYVHPSDPRNTTTFVRSPVMDQNLQYGLDFTIGTAGGTGVTMLDAIPACSVSQEIMEAAASPGKCSHQNVIFTREERCYDATKLAKEWKKTCQACHTYEIRRYSQPGEKLSDVKPLSAPARPVTPGNNLISAIMITQRRKKSTLCHPDPSVPGECNEECQMELATLGPLYKDQMCKSDELDDQPFGIDPSFLESSKLFKGNLQRELAYSEDEISPESGSPYGFFASPLELGNVQDLFAIPNPESNVPLYRLYIDARMHAEAANNAVDVMVEGGFLTNLTESVSFEFATFNAKLRHFAAATVIFEFHDGGLIEAHYNVESFAMADIESSIAEFAVFIVIVLLCFQMFVAEFKEVVSAAREEGCMGIYNYFTDLSNLLDVGCIFSVPLSLVFVFSTGAMLTDVLDLSSAGDLPRVLANPEGIMRRFATVESEEIRFLDTRHMITIFITVAKTSRSWVGINVLLLTARFFKMLHFQGRMGLVTRTFANSLVDIAHFTVIFGIVIVLYGVMGQFMFGTQMAEFRGIGQSMMMLVSTTLTLGIEDYNRMIGVSPSMDYITTIFWLTFLFLSTVVLLNIFLAILVEGFSVVKETATNSETLIQGYTETFTHDTWELRERLLHMLKCLTPKQRSRFISNKRMSELLHAWLYHIDTTLGEEEEDKKETKEEESRRKSSNVIRLLAGEEMSEKDLMNLLIDLIDEAPEKVLSFKRRAWQLSKALKNTSKTVAPMSSVDEMADVEKGKSVEVHKEPLKETGFQRFRRRSSSFGSAASFWEGLRDEVGPKDTGGTGKAGGRDLQALSKIGRSETNGSGLDLGARTDKLMGKSKRIARVTRQVMGRYGEKPQEEQHAEEALKVLKAQLLEKQIDQFKQVAIIEKKVQGMEKRMDEISDLGTMMRAIARHLEVPAAVGDSANKAWGTD